MVISIFLHGFFQTSYVIFHEDSFLNYLFNLHPIMANIQTMWSNFVFFFMSCVLLNVCKDINNSFGGSLVCRSIFTMFSHYFTLNHMKHAYLIEIDWDVQSVDFKLKESSVVNTLKSLWYNYQHAIKRHTFPLKKLKFWIDSFIVKYS